MQSAFPQAAPVRTTMEAPKVALLVCGAFREGTMLTRLMMLTGLVAMMLAGASAAHADRRVALVVGN